MSEETRGALHRERFAKLQVEFDELVKMGAAGPEDFRTVAFRMLKAFENVRLKNHGQIDKLRQEIAFCEATQRACDLFENLLIGLIEAHKNEVKQGLETKVLGSEGQEVPTDTDVLKTICVCGCRDEEDAASCSCSCHKGIPCGLHNCSVCAAKATLAETPAGDVMERTSHAEPKPKASTKRKRSK